MSKKKGAAKPLTEGLVIDSSVSIAWCFLDEQDDYSQSVLDALVLRKRAEITSRFQEVSLERIAIA